MASRGGSAPQVAANHEDSDPAQSAPGMRSRSEKMARAVAVSVPPPAVDSGEGGGRPLAPGAPTSATPPASRTFRAGPRHERAARSRTFHSAPDQSRPLRLHQRPTRYLSTPPATLTRSRDPFPARHAPTWLSPLAGCCSSDAPGFLGSPSWIPASIDNRSRIRLGNWLRLRRWAKKSRVSGSLVSGHDGPAAAGDGDRQGGVAAELAAAGGGGGGGRGGRAAADGGAARNRTAAVPDQDVRPGGRPGHRRRRLVGPRGQQLRRVEPARVRRRAAPQVLQAQQFLQLRPPAQHLPPWIHKTRMKIQETACLSHKTHLITTKRNIVGFRKIDPDRWEFANEGFLMGQRHLLRMIKRRRPPSYLASSQQQALGCYLEVGHYGPDEEIGRLKRDKNVLLAEVVKLRQEQQSTKADMRAMEERLQHAESKQGQMMGFLARAMQNPDFFQQLLLQNQDKRRELEDSFSKKRRRPIDIVPFAAGTEVTATVSCQTTTTTQQGEELDPALFFGPSASRRGVEELSEPGISELENLALNIQGLGKRKQDREQANQGGEEAELTDDFWEELLNEGTRGEGELSVPEMERRRPPERYVGALAQKLSYLSE